MMLNNEQITDLKINFIKYADDIVILARKKFESILGDQIQKSFRITKQTLQNEKYKYASKKKLAEKL